MLAFRAVRKVLSVPARRNMSVFDKKNTIHETRAKYYSNPATGAENPTYLKEPGDKLLVAFGFTGVVIGLSVIARGLYSMTYGINKVQK